MTCPHCSAAIADGSRFCAACGAGLTDAPAQDGGAPSPSGTPAGRPAGGNPGSLWLALNMALTVFSCLGNVVSIVGIVFGAISVARYSEGRYEEAQNNANVSKWLLIAGAVLLVFGGAVAVIVGVLPAVLAFLGLLWMGATSSFTTF